MTYTVLSLLNVIRIYKMTMRLFSSKRIIDEGFSHAVLDIRRD